MVRPHCRFTTQSHSKTSKKTMGFREPSFNDKIASNDLHKSLAVLKSARKDLTPIYICASVPVPNLEGGCYEEEAKKVN